MASKMIAVTCKGCGKKYAVAEVQYAEGEKLIACPEPQCNGRDFIKNTDEHYWFT